VRYTVNYLRIKGYNSKARISKKQKPNLESKESRHRTTISLRKVRKLYAVYNYYFTPSLCVYATVRADREKGPLGPMIKGFLEETPLCATKPWRGYFGGLLQYNSFCSVLISILTLCLSLTLSLSN
jgi:hypothetical protein